MEIAASVTLGFRAGSPRQARLATFHDAAGEAIDRGLYCVFPAPNSYTGEDLVEFSCHGGLVAPARLLSALHVAGARPAHPGEFTRRAVLNGKLDLVQAEAVGDLISATAPAQARAALYQLDGGLSRRIHGLREELVELQALLGYQVDFPEEDDGPLPRARLADQLSEVAARIDRLLATAPAAQRVREGALVVLAGPPNAGNPRCSMHSWVRIVLWSPRFRAPPATRSRRRSISWAGQCAWLTRPDWARRAIESMRWEWQ
jgi:tRNA modification GTPase